jgi:hypothetical protein
MSAPKPAATNLDDPVLAAFENAPVDQNAVTPEEAAALDARMMRGHEGRGRSSEEVLAAIAERAKREG